MWQPLLSLWALCWHCVLLLSHRKAMKMEARDLLSSIDACSMIAGLTACLLHRISAFSLFFFWLHFWGRFTNSVLCFKRFFFKLRWLFVAVSRLSPVVVSGGSVVAVWWLLLWGTGSRPAGFSSCTRGLSRCGAWAQLLRSMWYLPRPGIEPESLALQGRFLTTREALKCFLLVVFSWRDVWGN